MMMGETLKIIFILLPAILNLILGLLVSARNSKSRLNQTFALITFLISIWSVSLLLYDHPLIFSNFFWIKTSFLVFSFLQVFILSFSLIYPKSIFPKLKIWAKFYSGAFLTLTIWLLYWTDTWVVNLVSNFSKGYLVQLGSGYVWWVLAVSMLCCWSLFNIFQNIRHNKGMYKAQLHYIFVGLSFWLIASAVPMILLPLIKSDTSYLWLAPVSSLLFSAAISYAILRHRMLDVRLVVTRTIIYTLLTLLIVSFFAVSLFVVGYWFFPIASQESQFFVSILLAVVVAYAFNPLKKFLEKFTDRIFFRDNYDPTLLLNEISHVLISTLELETVIKKAFKVLDDKIHLEFITLLLFDEKNRVKQSVGDRLSTEIVKLENPALKKISQGGLRLHFCDYLSPDSSIKIMMQKYDIGGISLLKSKDKTLGLLMLGNKKSGNVFHENDIKVIEILSPPLTIALDNINRYQEIQQFSNKLKIKVKEATIDLQIANKKLKQLDKLKDEFISVAAHELRAPLTAVKGYLSMVLEGDAGKVPTKINQFLQGAFEGAEREVRLVNNMLNVSRIEENRLIYQMGIVNLSKIAKIVFDEFKSNAESKKLKFSLDLPKNIKDKIYVDQDRIHEVVVNIVNNAIKYTDQGYVKIKLSNPNENTIRCQVEDSGYGIGKKETSKLFKKFYRTQSSSGKKLGTGLGLYVTKLLIEKFNGKIGLTSELKKGSTFWFELPLTQKK
jgi:signal transduction histidine kinase